MREDGNVFSFFCCLFLKDREKMHKTDMVKYKNIKKVHILLK